VTLARARKWNGEVAGGPWGQVKAGKKDRRNVDKRARGRRRNINIKRRARGREGERDQGQKGKVEEKKGQKKQNLLNSGVNINTLC
jgi:hypothetical protein